MSACSRCGQENPAVALFCLSCGTRLPQGPPSRGQERKVVTVLFCDLVGSTTRSDQTDPEDVRATLSSYFNRLRREVERHGGTIEKFIGDAVVAVFGAPDAHEDDPERAVRCSFAMIRAIDDLNDQTPGLDLSVRIGISTGETLVSPEAAVAGEGIVTGAVVNVASRLQEIAPVGGAVVTETTYRATKHLVEYGELSPVLIKGINEPLQVWRPVGLRSRVGVDVDRRTAANFIDREDELEVLKRTFNRALREPSVQLVTIMGEPGVGKSRLVREFAIYLDGRPELTLWRGGRCLSYGEGITYWALSQIVKAHAGILESDPADTIAAKLESAMAEALSEPAERDWIRARLDPLLGTGTSEPVAPDPSEFHAAWRRFLEAVASARPLVLALEDLHWADGPMLAFVEHLVEWATDVPLLVLCTARPELYERHPSWGGGKRNSTTISLAPLGWEETAQLISALLSEPMLSPETETELLERAGGNPLYAEEFAQMVREQTLPQDFTFPDTLHAIIAARLDALPPALKGLLQDASVVGKVFWSGALTSMSGIEHRAVLDALHELTRRELVRPARASSVKDQAEFGFWHVLIRDVAYGEIPRGARAKKHRAAAEWIEQLTGARPSERAELLAYHYSEALELARASAMTEEVSALEPPLLESLLTAGEAAMRLDASRAARHYTRALEFVRPDHADRAEILARAAQASARSGRFEEAERLYKEVVDVAQAKGNQLQAGDAMVGLASVLWHRGETARGRKTLEEGIRLLESEGPSQELTRAYAQVAFDAAASGHLQEGVAWSNKALEMADRLEVVELRAQSLAFRGGARGELGDLGGLDDLREALKLTQDLGLPRETAQVQVILGDMLWATDGPKASLEALQAGIEVAERRGITDMAMSIQAETVRPLFDLGEWDGLLDVADRVTRWFQARGGGYFEVLARIFKYRVEVCRGSSRASATQEFLPVAREIGDVQVLIPGLAVAALHEQVEGNLEAASLLIEEVEDLAKTRSDWYLMAFLPDLVRLCLATDRLTAAESLLARMRVPPVQRENCLVAGQAMLAEYDARYDEASILFSDSAARWRGKGFVFELGQSLLGEGRCLTRLKLPDATDRLIEAQTLFESLGAHPALVELQPWLDQALTVSPSGA
jgi:class 3 adenylate cyclase/tetratricopeptide (TPR) repeat protein